MPPSSLRNDSKYSHYAENYDIDDFILVNTLARVSTDIAVLNTALEQRIANKQQAANTQTLAAINLDRLQIADRLAFNILRKQPLLQRLPPEKATALTYFRSSVSVRIVPYAPIPMIGIPATVLQANRDYLAIPHEIDIC